MPSYPELYHTSHLKDRPYLGELGGAAARLSGQADASARASTLGKYGEHWPSKSSNKIRDSPHAPLASAAM
jgi:hypothetical protein